MTSAKFGFWMNRRRRVAANRSTVGGYPSSTRLVSDLRPPGIAACGRRHPGPSGVSGPETEGASDE